MANHFKKTNRLCNIAKRSKCFMGHYHPSRLEAGYCNQLQMLKKTGQIKDFQTQKRVEYYIDGMLICRHYVDFYIEYPDGHFEYHETKGFATEIWNIKHRLFKALFPNEVYKVIR